MTCSSRKFFSFNTGSRTLIFILLLSWMLPCGWPASPDSARAAATAELLPHSSIDQLPDSIHKLLGTDWYGIYFQENKIGHATITMEHANYPAGPEYRFNLAAKMALQFRGNVLKMLMEVSWRFDGVPPYRLNELINRIKSGDEESELIIRRANNDYSARISQGTEISRMELGSFNLKLNDLLAVPLWLQQNPAVGDQIGYADLDLDTLEVDQGFAKLLKKETRKVNGVDLSYYTVLETPASGPELTSVYGADGKSFTTSMGGAFLFRLEPEALAVKVDLPMDLFVNNFVGVDTALGDPAKVIWLIAALDDRSGSKIREAPGQSVTLDPATGHYIVTTTPGQGPRIRPTAAEIDQNLKATTELPIYHPKVVDLARQAVKDAHTAAEKVARLVHFVAAYITDDYNANPLTLFDIIAKRRGDCSEHARLFTALARALAIPCREVSGLSYVGDNLRGFYPHAWNEVVIDDYWVPVDPTWGQTTIDATHIRLAVDENEMLQIMAAVPNMKLTILDFDTREDKPPGSEDVSAEGQESR